MSTPYIGQILIFAGTFAPKNFAFCNGQVLSINSNQGLYAVLGTTYGGNGTSTFALPNMQGTAVLHSGGGSQGNGVSAYSPGQTTGSENITLTVPMMPAHTHTPAGNSAVGTSVSPSLAYWAQSSKGAQFATSSPDGIMAPGAIASTGSNQAHYNMQPYLVLNYIIALTGIYPSRG